MKNSLNYYRVNIQEENNRIIADYKVQEAVFQEIEALINRIQQDTETFKPEEKQEIIQLYLEYEYKIKEMFSLGFSEKEREVEHDCRIFPNKKMDKKTIALGILKKKIDSRLEQEISKGGKEKEENPMLDIILVDRRKFLAEAIEQRWFERQEVNNALQLTKEEIEKQKKTREKEIQII